MDAGTLRGLFTALLMLLFIGICIWAFSSKRKDDFARLSNLPLEDDSKIPGNEDSQAASIQQGKQ